MFAIKALVGGSLVVLFSLISNVVHPRMFSGIFAAAPSVAIAGLLVEGLSKGETEALSGVAGMAVGSVGMVACCLAATFTTRRLGSLWGTAGGWTAWILAVAALYRLVLGRL